MPLSSPTSIEINTDYQNAERFLAWMALCVFSAVCVAAVNSQQISSARNRDDKWVLSVTILSLFVSLLACVAYLTVRHVFVAKIPEYLSAVFLLGIWAGGLPVIMNPANGIAVLRDTVLNANLYFFSWVSLGVIVYITASLLQEYSGINVKQSTLTQGKTGKWFGYSAATILCMVSSVRLFQTNQCVDVFQGTEYCRRTNFGIAIGCLGFVSGIIMAICISVEKVKVSAVVELIVAGVSLAVWCFGVGFITFGISPGSKIGNLYFSSWISFIVIVLIFSSIFRDYMAGWVAGEGDETTPNASSETGEAPPLQPTAAVGTGKAPTIPDDEDI